MAMRSRSAITALVLCPFLYAGAAGQEPAEEPATETPVVEMPVFEVSPIRVWAILPTELEDVPGAASRFTDEDIERVRPFNLHEALRHVPGIVAIDDDGLALRSGIGIRGGAPRRSRKVLLLEDGIPINAASYLDPSGHYTPPMERVESIEVLKGAGQIIHGPLNNHGIINFRNVRPTLDPFTVLSGSLGTGNSNRRHLLHSDTFGNVGAVFAYTGADADGVFDTERLRFNDFYGAVTFSRDAHDLRLSTLYYRERSDYDETNLTAAQFATNPRCKSCFVGGADFNNISVDYVQTQLAHDFFVTDDLTVSSKLFASHMFRPRFESRRGGPAVAGGSMRGRERTYRQGGAETRIELADQEFLGLSHTLRFGVRGERQLFDNENTVGRVGEVLDRNNRGFARVVAGVGGFRDSGRIEKYGATAVSTFVQDEISIDNFTITPGVRFEHFTQTRSTKFDQGLPIDPARERTTTNILLPGVSVLYDGFDRTELYAGVHRGYSPAIARTDAFPLEAEIGITTQVGMRTRAIQGVTLEAAAYHNHLDNTLVKLTVTDAFGNNVFINSGSARVFGAELGARVDSNAFVVSPYNLYGEVNYAFIDARFTTQPIKGNFVPEIPQHVGNFTLGLEHVDGWDVSATLSHFGSFFTDVANTVAEDPSGEIGRVPSHTLLSARANWTLGDSGVTLFLAGTNLTDKLYISDRQDGIRPGLGRTVFGGITYRADNLLGDLF